MNMKQPRGEIIYPNVGLEIMDPEEQFKATYRMVELQKQRWGNRKIAIYLLDHSGEQTFRLQEGLYDHFFGKKYTTRTLAQSKDLSQRGIRRITSPPTAIIKGAEVAYVVDNIIHTGAAMGGGVFYLFLNDGEFEILETHTPRDEKNLSHYCIVRVVTPGQYEEGMKQFFEEKAPHIKSVIDDLSKQRKKDLMAKIPPFSREREDLYHVYEPTSFQAIMNTALELNLEELPSSDIIRRFDRYVQKVGKRVLALPRDYSATIVDLSENDEVMRAANVLAAILESRGIRVYHDKGEQQENRILGLTKHLYEDREVFLVKDVLDVRTHEFLKSLGEDIKDKTHGIHLVVLNYVDGEPELITYHQRDGKPSKTKNGLSNTVQAARSASR